MQGVIILSVLLMGFILFLQYRRLSKDKHSRFYKGEDKQDLQSKHLTHKMLCEQGTHYYNDKCTCVICGETDHHPDNNCSCIDCGEVAHTYYNGFCLKCGECAHTWYKCKCILCGEVRDKYHEWDENSVCNICNTKYKKNV